MLSLKNAMMPPPANIIRISSTIGRRVSPKVSRPLITGLCLHVREVARRDADLQSVSARRHRDGIAQEQGAFGGDEVAGLHAFEDLVVAVTRQADLDRAPGKAS